MKKVLIVSLVVVAAISLVSFKNNMQNPAAKTSFTDTILFEGEKHFANMQQLTFGGDNAEAYFSYDGKWLIYQYTNAKAGANVKSAAQGLITLATYGVGMLIGFWVAGKIVETNGDDWQTIWTYPAIFAIVILVLFLFTFKDEKIEYQE